MDWRLASLTTFVMWAGYAVFGSVASRAHGENVNMSIEALAMVLVAVIAMMRVGFGEFSRVTSLSITQAVIMGLLSAVGLMVQFYAFRVAPHDKQGSVVMISCMFPILAVVIFHMMTKVGVSGGTEATPKQWLGIIFGALAMWLIK